MIRIAFFDSKNYDINAFDSELQQLGPEQEVQIVYYEAKLSSKTANIITEDFDVICSFVNDKIDDEVIQAMKRCKIKLLALRCAGFNHVDFSSLKNSIPVVRVPAYSPNAVAEHALSLMCALNRKIHRAYHRVRDGNFSIQGLVGFDFYRKTAGIIGTGKIGRAMISILQGLGMEILACDPFPSPELEEQGVRYCRVEELCQKSDIISLHCPLTPETKYIINYDTLALMKRNVTLINTSRGGLINTQDLIYALKKDRINGAGLDVYEEEEAVFFEDHSLENLKDEQLLRLMSFNNVVLTAHQAFLTKEALSEIAHTTLHNIVSYIHKGELHNQVLPDQFG
ncbi:2-hydroxyacid dehydrogenase [Candidatus Haliotispira prima]|uniref:2-hydroxyacid dehydrogenase n=1 Tax=Candidatus Haliotispira prima TaxID=3034016 RepID=A0ABY8MKI1_9SPIO|nr:2-hydroxyacid dehydrogenase [Candidatus Haliotispira prima]